MSHQLAVRLPDDLAAFVESEVARGHAPSRASVVERALRRELRWRTAMSDIEALQQATRADTADDLDGLAAYAARQPLDVD